MRIFLLTCLLSSLAFADQLDTLVLQHKVPDELVPVLRAAFPEASIQGIQGRLLIRAADQAHFDQIAAMVRKLDQPSRRLQISVQQRDSASSAQLALDGQVLISNQGVKGGVQISAHERASSQQSLQTLRVMDGGRAMIKLGSERFIPVRRSGFAGEWQTAASGFWAEPRLVGDTIHLRIFPESSRFERDGSMVTHQMSSDISFRLGEWVLAGETVSTGLPSEGRQQYQVWLKVDAD
ncbi:hypothetical protein [Iodobacter fluviatilis]|uniref:NolW-like domain-containing protein n=1 Tax=Iodobacter fluviatilis TaxID=537 RepID=A0A377SXE6_9NEIS|nr:hypothetical protein [Iodobacter fluviatilis]TCU81144.1 hypothetical protein EV682_12714 [Iodobacter fluviatilis]STR46018.1 Uncharacterised protein [Iodobacter fluviatilis]